MQLKCRLQRFIIKIYIDSIVSVVLFQWREQTDHNKGPSCKFSDQNQAKLNFGRDYVQTDKRLLSYSVQVQDIPESRIFFFLQFSKDNIGLLKT